GWLSAAGRGLVWRTGRDGPGGDERQRLLLRLARPPRGPARARAQTPAHQAWPPTHQRQGRAVYPDLAQRVGLRPRLRQLRRTHGGTAVVPRQIQLQTPTRLPRLQGAGHELEQPRWELQLAHKPR